MSATGATAHFQPFGGSGGAVGFQGATGGMKVGQEVSARVEFFWSRSTCGIGDFAGVASTHALLVLLVQLDHALASKVKSICRGQEREEADLHHGVVQNLVLAGFMDISILELPSDSAVTGGDGDTSSEGGARLQDDGASHKSQRAVNQGRIRRSHVFVGLRIDAGESGEHVGVGNFDIPEEQETVVHGVVAELGTDVADMDVGESLVRLQVADLDHEGMRSVVLAADEELSHHDCMVGGLSQ